LRRSDNLNTWKSGSLELLEPSVCPGLYKDSLLYKVLAGIHDGQRPHVRSRPRWKYIAKLDVEEVGSTGFIWLRTV
jgi:hypothetical protein